MWGDDNCECIEGVGVCVCEGNGEMCMWGGVLCVCVEGGGEREREVTCVCV